MFTLAFAVGALLYFSVGAIQLRPRTPGNSVPIESVTPSQWSNLNASVAGRLLTGVPFAEPCFSIFDGKSVVSDTQSCSNVQKGYFSTSVRSDNFGAYQSPQWETCQSTSQKCFLDSANPLDASAFSPPQECYQGSVSPFYVDVRTAQDVSASFKFSAQTGVPLVIKNTGHDYQGRSGTPNSLALWTHNLKGNITYDPYFVANGCPNDTSAPGVTYQAGEKWEDLYNFADSHNITVVGGAQMTVGSAGGFLQGGGHGPLTSSFGLASDRALEFKVVTPDGTLRVASACQNTDLFFALRGGGGGTFGVVMETTAKALPALTIQVVFVSFEPTATNVPAFLSLLVANTQRWAEEGWGAYILPSSALYINPKLTKTEAAASMNSIIEFATAQAGNKTITVTEEPSYLSFYSKFIDLISGPSGQALAIGGRFIPATNFATTVTQSQLVATLTSFGSQVDVFEILAVTPFSAPAVNGTSTTESWRTSLWHVTAGTVWASNATAAETKAGYNRMTQALNVLRDITPGAGAYLNEADVYEPDWQNALYGTNYPKLLEIKNKYDPSGILDCWHCVGWTGAHDPRFSCYL